MTEKPWLRSELAAQNALRGGRQKLTGHVLRGAQEADRIVCAEHHVPDLAPARFLVEMREDEVLDGQRREGPRLRDHEGRLVGRVEDQVHPARAQVTDD